MSKIKLKKTEADKKISQARAAFEKYRQGKVNLESRIVEEEKAWKLQMWSGAEKNGQIVPSSSAYMWNAVVNKHAEVMDNYPTPIMLPREQSDKKEAEMLTNILPVILVQYCPYTGPTNVCHLYLAGV